MNSWKSTELSAWAPPLSDVHHRHGQDPRRLAAEVAPQRQALLVPPPRARAASETPRIALAPRRDLFGVPSRSISARSRPDWSSASRPAIASAISPLTLADGLRDALAHPGVAAVAQLGGLELAGRGAGRHGGAAVGAGAQRRPRPRRWGCRASRGSGGRGRSRSGSSASPAVSRPGAPRRSSRAARSGAEIVPVARRRAAARSVGGLHAGAEALRRRRAAPARGRP